MTHPSDPPHAFEEHERPAARWARRAVTIPAVFSLAALAAALLPLVPALAVVDAIRPRRSTIARAALLIAVFLWCEVLGLLAAFAVWLAGPGSGSPGSPRHAAFLRANARLQAAWNHALFVAVSRIFRVSLHVENPLAARPTGRPLLVLVRHASTADVILPVELLAWPLGLRLRFVLKAELLADPCLDVVGQRLPNCFVRRGRGQGEREAERVVALCRDLDPDEAVVIFPEGTRFTGRKRAAAIAALGDHGPPAALVVAQSLVRTLSPLRRGPLALLASLAEFRDTDLLVIAHAGLEAAGSFAALHDGGLLDASLRVRMIRVPAAEIPDDAPGREQLLAELWREVDRFAAPAAAA